MFYYVRDSGDQRPHFDARRAMHVAGLWIVRSHVRLAGFHPIDSAVVREYFFKNY